MYLRVYFDGNLYIFDKFGRRGGFVIVLIKKDDFKFFKLSFFGKMVRIFI